jgi:RNA polymerase sigma factor (sigma-70 family)
VPAAGAAQGVDPLDQESRNQHLSHISTLWSLVYQAHQGSPETVSAAQRRLLERYSGAIHRYLLGALRDPDAADDLFQEFALRFLRGDFKRADPQRGRFRSFVKTSLFHLVIDHQRRRREQAPAPLADGQEPATQTPELDDAERRFVESWRDELMDRSWQALAEVERRTGQPHYTVLRCRSEQPLLSSAELAEQLGTRLGREFTVHGVRQALHRARDKMADLLLHEVIQSLDNPTPQELEDELTDLGLLSYCRGALDRRGGRLV